ncbi:type IV pilus twitching motility protein PilT [Phosphitispora fastidiosa]|uniref:type IV pilus twitching motility protein PilT n=1 Tax=Phosphitispora fastidiosa TaxID=2837202 RepID=UPI001E38AF89|nr:type IV pilus twitching motility protein PilT [Phosphitispora fastidiosa]MBU7008774.1 twitching motility protein PilT [Phosphitispora fastidiosa]
MHIDDLLKKAVDMGASDLHITTNASPVIRINGSTNFMAGNKMDRHEILELAKQIMGAEHSKVFEQQGEVDFSYAIYGFGRFRVNVFKQRGSVAMSIRVVPPNILTPEELGLPEVVKTMAMRPHGLVLVTGPTGSGKSTTLAAMIDLLNKEIQGHIITLEDPIEFLHTHRNCIVNQREIGIDTESFASGLRSALRQDPDIILVGEMRDLDTISTAITAAETGHLVLATLHTSNAVQTIDRIIDVFPPYQQNQVRVQLALILEGIIAQTLLPRVDGKGRVAAVEVLVANSAVRNLIREGKTHQLPTIIQSSLKIGMQTMDYSLRDLYMRGIISYEDARKRTLDQENFARLVQRL